MATRRKPAILSTDVYQALARSSANPSALALEHVRYFVSDEIQWLELSFMDHSRPAVVIAVSRVAELAQANVQDLLGLQLSPARDTIISESLDVHISVEGLIRDLWHNRAN